MYIDNDDALMPVRVRAGNGSVSDTSVVSNTADIEYVFPHSEEANVLENFFYRIDRYIEFSIKIRVFGRGLPTTCLLLTLGLNPIEPWVVYGSPAPG